MLNTATAERSVEPLIFRSMVEHSHASSLPVPANAEQTAAPTDVFDLETELNAAREQGRLEGIAEANQDCERKVRAERETVQATLRQFEREKLAYFAAVESEVVKLSLAIAERVLHREAAMDPLLLAGVARVALNQIADSGEAKLHVAAIDLDRWNETLKPTPKGLVVEGDETLKRGDVVLKTSSGTVDLGLRVQLQEIERGFFEVLGRKPSMVV